MKELTNVKGFKKFSELTPEEQRERLAYLRFRLKVICLGLFWIVRMKKLGEKRQVEDLNRRSLRVITFDDEDSPPD